MKRSREFKSRFWDRKILSWEKARYRQPNAGETSNSVHYRLFLATKILNQAVSHLSLLDLGCGSGHLFENLNSDQFSSLIGIDISQNAIENARLRLGHRAQFLQADVTQTPLPAADCIVALGLLDWLASEEIFKIASQLNCKYFLFSFSEKRQFILRSLHRIYTVASYGWRNSLYLPRYYNEMEIRRALTPLLDKDMNKDIHSHLRFIRDPKLSFGTLLTNLPTGD